MEWFNLNMNNMEIGKTTANSKLIKFVGGDFVGYSTWVPIKLVKGEGNKTQVSFTKDFKFKVTKTELNTTSKKWEVVDEREVTGEEFAEHYKENVIPNKTS